MLVPANFERDRDKFSPNGVGAKLRIFRFRVGPKMES